MFPVWPTASDSRQRGQSLITQLAPCLVYPLDGRSVVYLPQICTLGMGRQIPRRGRNCPCAYDTGVKLDIVPRYKRIARPTPLDYPHAYGAVARLAGCLRPGRSNPTQALYGTEVDSSRGKRRIPHKFCINQNRGNSIKP